MNAVVRGRVQFDRLRQKNREILMAFRQETMEMNNFIKSCKMEQEDRTAENIVVTYNTRRKVHNKNGQQLIKTRKQEKDDFVFECIELEVSDKESNCKGFRSLGSPVLGGLMITDFKTQRQMESHKCTEFK